MSKNIFVFRREFVTCSDEFADANRIRIRDITVKTQNRFSHQRKGKDWFPFLSWSGKYMILFSSVGREHDRK